MPPPEASDTVSTVWTVLLVPVLAGVFLLVMERLETRLLDVAPDGAGLGRFSRSRAVPGR